MVVKIKRGEKDKIKEKEIIKFLERHPKHCVIYRPKYGEYVHEVFRPKTKYEDFRQEKVNGHNVFFGLKGYIGREPKTKRPRHRIVEVHKIIHPIERGKLECYLGHRLKLLGIDKLERGKIIFLKKDIRELVKLTGKVREEELREAGQKKRNPVITILDLF